jgi:hypothetical protein
MAEDVFGSVLLHPLARYVEPGVCGARPGGDEKGLRSLGFVDSRQTADEVVAIDGKTVCARRFHCDLIAEHTEDRPASVVASGVVDSSVALGARASHSSTATAA